MIGLFDSGVGGLAVWQVLKEKRPDMPTIYLADQAYAPYGEKNQDQLIARAQLIVQTLIERGATMIVVACNTATVNTIDALRISFPHIPFIGIEPAIKPAAAAADRIIMLGTNSTVTNLRYRALAKQYASGKTVWNVAAPELVAAVEAGHLAPMAALRARVKPLIDQGAQALVIGCTHFSFLVPVIARHWPKLQIFDGRYGTVEQTLQIAHKLSLTASDQADSFLTTGPSIQVKVFKPTLHFNHLALDSLSAGT